MNEIQKSLAQDAQRTEERMPNEMTHQTAVTVGQRLGEFMAASGYTQKEIGRKLGISTTAVSQFINGKYNGSLEPIINKAVNFMDTAGRRNRRKKGEFVQTTVARAIYTVIKNTEGFTDSECGIGVICGDAGHGKSKCLQEYVNANKNSVYVELDATMSSQAIFAEICRALKIDNGGGLKRLTATLVEFLRDREMTVILDEASFLRVKQLDQLRQIIAVRGRCPLILAGNGQLLKTINDDSSRRGYEALDQFYSRLVRVLNLDEEAAAGDGGGLYTADDIRKLYEQGGVRLTGGGVKTLQRICRTPQTGRLRTCSRIYEALLTSPVIDEGKIDGSIILAVIKALGLPIMHRLPYTLAELVSEEPAEERKLKTA
ncbi:MAG: AAA family ATPase [Patescibacteria group bacterium]